MPVPSIFTLLTGRGRKANFVGSNLVYFGNLVERSFSARSSHVMSSLGVAPNKTRPETNKSLSHIVAVVTACLILQLLRQPIQCPFAARPPQLELLFEQPVHQSIIKRAFRLLAFKVCLNLPYIVGSTRSTPSCNQSSTLWLGQRETSTILSTNNII